MSRAVIRDALRELRRKSLRSARNPRSDNANTALLISIGMGDQEPHAEKGTPEHDDIDDDGVPNGSAQGTRRRRR